LRGGQHAHVINRNEKDREKQDHVGDHRITAITVTIFSASAAGGNTPSVRRLGASRVEPNRRRRAERDQAR
jgi:hypothetical protein